MLGPTELYIECGSTINLTCVIRESPEPPAYIIWTHNNMVSIGKIWHIAYIVTRVAYTNICAHSAYISMDEWTWTETTRQTFMADLRKFTFETNHVNMFIDIGWLLSWNEHALHAVGYWPVVIGRYCGVHEASCLLTHAGHETIDICFLWAARGWMHKCLGVRPGIRIDSLAHEISVLQHSYSYIFFSISLFLYLPPLWMPCGAGDHSTHNAQQKPCR